jgi:hypothetical protein
MDTIFCMALAITAWAVVLNMAFKQMDAAPVEVY